MVLEVLSDINEIDSGLLVKAVLADSAGKELTTVVRSLSAQDQEVTVETLTNDILVTIGLDPWQARRAAHAIVRNKFVVPILAAEIEYQHDQYQRINKTKNPVAALIADVAIQFADREDALILGATDVTIGDNEGIANASNHTAMSTALNMSTFALAASTIALAIGQLVSGMKGMVRKHPMILCMTPDVENAAAGVLNTNSDKTVLQLWDETLKLRGGPGSGILVADNLGATATFADGLLVITTTTLNVALVLVTPKVMSTFASPYEQRLRPYNSADGYYNKVVERWLHLVHDTNGIIYHSTAVLS